jgi:hypothetical protein
MTTNSSLDRRRFFQPVGGGVVVVSVGPDLLRPQDAKCHYREDFNACLVVSENGMPKFCSATRVEAVRVKNDKLVPQGGGEPAFAATGGPREFRLRRGWCPDAAPAHAARQGPQGDSPRAC